VALTHAHDRKQAASGHSMPFDASDRIPRARWLEPAHATHAIHAADETLERSLVNLYDQDDDVREHGGLLVAGARMVRPRGPRQRFRGTGLEKRLDGAPFGLHVCETQIFCTSPGDDDDVHTARNELRP
jgi:hypothetical protein